MLFRGENQNLWGKFKFEGFGVPPREKMCQKCDCDSVFDVINMPMTLFTPKNTSADFSDLKKYGASDGNPPKKHSGVRANNRDV